MARPSVQILEKAKDSAATKELSLDPYRLAIFGLLLVSIGRVHQHFSFVAAFRPGALLVVVAVAYALMNRQAINLTVLREWPFRVIAALVVWACITAPFGLSLGNSGYFVLFIYSKVIVTALLLGAAVRGTTDLRTLVWAYVLSCGVLVLFAWTVFDITQASSDGFMRLGNLYRYDANDIGLLFSIGIPLGLWLAQTSTAGGRILSVSLVLGMVATLARSGSRGAFLGLAAVGLALLFLVRQVSWGRKALLLAVGIGVLSVAAPPGYWQQMETIGEPTEDYNWESQYGRKQIWERGVGYMVENPITGVGIDNFNRAEGLGSERARRIRAGLEDGRIRWVAPHNSFVQVGAEMGIPGLTIYSLLLLGGFVSLRRWNGRLSSIWSDDRGSEHQFLYLATVYLPVAFVGFAVTSFFLTFAYLDPVYILAALTGATLFLLRRLEARARAPETMGWRSGVGSRTRLRGRRGADPRHG